MTDSIHNSSDEMQKPLCVVGTHLVYAKFRAIRVADTRIRSITLY